MINISIIILKIICYLSDKTRKIVYTAGWVSFGLCVITGILTDGFAGWFFYIGAAALSMTGLNPSNKGDADAAYGLESDHPCDFDDFGDIG
jgi:hypothetical protein